MKLLNILAWSIDYRAPRGCHAGRRDLSPRRRGPLDHRTRPAPCRMDAGSRLETARQPARLPRNRRLASVPWRRRVGLGFREAIAPRSPRGLASARSTPARWTASRSGRGSPRGIARHRRSLRRHAGRPRPAQRLPRRSDRDAQACAGRATRERNRLTIVRSGRCFASAPQGRWNPASGTRR